MKIIPVDTLHIQTAEFAWIDLDGAWDRSWKNERRTGEGKVESLCVEWHDKATGWHFKISGSYLRIEGSLRKLLNSRNTSPLLLADLNKVADYLQSVFAKLHVRCKVEDFRIVRIDLCRDFASKDSVLPIIGLFSRIYSFDRFNQRAKPSQFDDAYVRWEKTGTEIVLYDKTPDYSPNDLLPRLKVLRCEVRLIGARACERVEIKKLSCLSDPKQLFGVWQRIFGGLIDEALKAKLFENGYVAGTAIQRLEKMIRSKGVRISNISACVAGIGGVEALRESLGGDRGLESWIKRFEIPSYKRSRIRGIVNRMRAYSPAENSRNTTKKALVDFKEWAFHGETQSKKQQERLRNER